MSINLCMILDRWPSTLLDTLKLLDPYVSRKIAIVDDRTGIKQLPSSCAEYFDAVRYKSGMSFEQLRNESLDLAREYALGPWVLIIDSDERVEFHALLKVLAATTHAQNTSAYLLPRFNYVGHGRWSTSYGFRLFRLDHPIAYRYQIHESISPSLIEHNLEWSYLNAPIQHLDFLDPIRGKRERYRALLCDAIDRGEDLAFLQTLYAIECVWFGEHEIAFQNLNSAIQAARDPELNRRFNGRDDFPVMLKAQLCLHLGRHDEAKALFSYLLDKAEKRVAAEACLGLALVADVEDADSAALTWLTRSLELWQTPEALMSRATLHALSGSSSATIDDLANGLELNPMAASPLIQGSFHEEDTYGLQSLLHKGYRGVDHLVRSLHSSAGAAF